MTQSSRREIIKGLVGGASALVLGFDPVHRSWVTSAAAAATVIAIPDLDGVVLTDSAALTAFADDYGHIVHRTPIAVLKPASIEDVVHAIRFCRQHRIHVAARGQGHSTAGQSQVQGGLVVDMSTLKAIDHIGSDSATVQAGLVWHDFVAATIPLGLTPPVLTGYIGLSVGGTLSMGGIGAASFRYGAQVDNVLELEVVTGEGELKRCSRWDEPLLFNAVLGGVGQYGIIVRAKLPLVAAPANARRYVITYTDFSKFFADMNTLTRRGRVDGVYALVNPDGSGGWIYAINAVKFFDTSMPPDDGFVLAGLTFVPSALQATTMDTFTYDTLVDSLFALLQSLGLNEQLSHVWGDLFLPASQTATFVQNSLATLGPADLGPAGFILLFPIRNLFPEAIAFRLPSEPEVFLFDVLTSGAPTDSSYAPTQIAKTRARFEQARAVGGTLYPIGSTPMTKADWIGQYGPIYPLLALAKKVYDPGKIMTPSPGIF